MVEYEWNEDLGIRKVVTWQNAEGSKIRLTEEQALTLRASGVWPRSAGGEYCQVSHGLHRGYPTYSDEYVHWCAHQVYDPIC